MIRKKNKPAATPGPFVLSATSLSGIDLDRGLLRTNRGLFISAVKIRGIDIEGLRPNDQEAVYAGWGAAEQACDLPRKIILCETRPDLSTQKRHIEEALQRQNNPMLRELLQRQSYWIDHYQTNQRDQAGYVLFFSKIPEEAEEARRRYIEHSAPSRIHASACMDLRELLEFCQILLSTPEWK